MPVIPIGEWLPDQPRSEGSALIRNVIPRTAKSYGPMPGMTVFSAAAPERVFGSYSVLAGDRTAYGFAAGATTISRILTDATWDDVSIAGGYTMPTFADGGGWDATAFGSRVIFTNYADPVQSYLCGTDTDFSDLSPDAPKARYCTTIRDFLFLGSTNDPIDGEQPRRLWWSSIGDPTDWPVPGSDLAIMRQSDFQDLEAAELGHLRGIVGGNLSGADGVAFMEKGLVRIAYVGSPAIWAFDVAEGASGTLSPWSLVPRSLPTPGGIRGVCYYCGIDGFYAFDGQASVPIGSGKWDRFVLDDMQASRRAQVLGLADPVQKLIMWAYVGAGATDLYNRLLVYNWEIGRAALCELDPVEWVMRTLQANLTLDDLDPFGTLETLPYSLDSTLWLRDGPAIGMFDTAHRLNNLTGPSLAADVETGEAGLDGRRTKLHGTARPIIEGNGGDLATIAVGHRERQSQVVVYDAEVPVNVLGVSPLRSTGRYMRLRLRLPAGAVFSHLQGIELAPRPEGRLR